ncbi:hypothetical protein JD969_08195 [Planctomycetota bacterium]|nr:hypothetical protein JD969_08195 [Planctomycetota bacterium]
MKKTKLLSAVTAFAASLCFSFSANAVEYHINDPSDPIVYGINAGDVLHLSGTGELPEYFSTGSDSTVHITGGTIGHYFNSNIGCVVNVSNGNFLGEYHTNWGGTTNIYAGDMAPNYHAEDGSTTNIYGGSMKNVRVKDFSSEYTGIVNIYGGTFDGYFHARSGSTINFYGSDFKLDGVPVTGLMLNIPHLVTGRSNLTLTGTNQDGSPLTFYLDNTYNNPLGNVIDTTAIINLVLVPEPASLSLLALSTLPLLARRRSGN